MTKAVAKAAEGAPDAAALLRRFAELEGYEQLRFLVAGLNVYAAGGRTIEHWCRYLLLRNRRGKRPAVIWVFLKRRRP